MKDKAPRGGRAVSVRGPTYERLKAAAIARGTTISKLLDDALLPFLDDQEKTS